jgi:hypothetical protein
LFFLHNYIVILPPFLEGWTNPSEREKGGVTCVLESVSLPVGDDRDGGGLRSSCTRIIDDLFS